MTAYTDALTRALEARAAALAGLEALPGPEGRGSGNPARSDLQRAARAAAAAAEALESYVSADELAQARRRAIAAGRLERAARDAFAALTERTLEPGAARARAGVALQDVLRDRGWTT